MNKFFFYLIFLISLYPFVFNVSGETITSNYFFLILIFFKLFHSKKVIINNYFIPIFLFYLSLIFILSTSYQIEFLSFFPRRVSSFLVFLFFFIFSFVRVEEKDFLYFKNSLVIISLFYSFKSAFLYVLNPDLGYALKSLVGSQRFGFILVFSFFILLFSDTYFKKFKVLLLFSSFVLLLGIFLTFSRSSIVSLFFGFSFIFLEKFTFNFKNILYIFSFCIICFLFILFYQDFLVVSFYAERLFGINGSNDYTPYNLTDSNSSEGYRINLFKKILFYCLNNPFTGSGFLGTWILSNDLSGSAHSQHFDILFRIGFIGFFIFYFYQFKMVLFYRKYDKGIFYGLTAVFVYGFFHETFKMSYGTFLFSFLFSIFINRPKWILNYKKPL